MENTEVKLTPEQQKVIDKMKNGYSLVYIHSGRYCDCKYFLKSDLDRDISVHKKTAWIIEKSGLLEEIPVAGKNKCYQLKNQSND